jgi:hypothetical protein
MDKCGETFWRSKENIPVTHGNFKFFDEDLGASL